MTDDVNIIEQPRQCVGVTHVEPLTTLGKLRTGAVRGVEQSVDRHHLVPVGKQRRPHPATDETGCAGE